MLRDCEHAFVHLARLAHVKELRLAARQLLLHVLEVRRQLGRHGCERTPSGDDGRPAHEADSFGRRDV